MRVESEGILPLTYYVTIMAGFVLIGFQELRRCRAMDTCCIAVDDVGPSPIVESCPASPLFDSVARWEFEAVNWQQEWKHILWTFHWRAKLLFTSPVSGIWGPSLRQSIAWRRGCNNWSNTFTQPMLIPRR